MNTLTRRVVVCSMLLWVVARAANDAAIVVHDNGLEFLAWARVPDAAVKRAQQVIQVMTSNVPAIRKRLAAVGFKVEIIGKDQVITDLPDYSDLKNRKTLDGRSFDTGTRGVGGKDKCSVGEENLVCSRNQAYPEEDILVHEFSHSIMSNMDTELSRAVEDAYQNALSRGLYPMNIYMMANKEEYWAEGTQVWFEVTVRTDVNAGFNTRSRLKAHDPMLTNILKRVYGQAKLQHLSGCAY